jgi:hypothetical protein
MHTDIAQRPTTTPSGSRSPAGRSRSTVHGIKRTAIPPRTERPLLTLPPYARGYGGRPPPRNRTKRASIAFPGPAGSKASQPGTGRLMASPLKRSKTSKRSTRAERGTGSKRVRG